MCGWLDVPLTPHGQQQAECLPRALAGSGQIVALYTSSLQRAVNTALAITRCLGTTPRALKSLREISCGDLEGLPVADVQRRYRRIWQANLAQDDDAFCWPGGESYRLFRVRVLKTLERLRHPHAGGTVVVVTHSGVISQVIGSLSGEPPACWESFRPATASVTEVRWTGDRGVVVRFNDRQHLRGLRSPESIGAPDDPQVLTHSSRRADPLTGGPAGRVHGDR
jgi:broad specificity phosphatase PhoE